MSPHPSLPPGGGKAQTTRWHFTSSGVTAMQPSKPFAFDITLTKTLAVDASPMQMLTAELNRQTELLTWVCEDLSAIPPHAATLP